MLQGVNYVTIDEVSEEDYHAVPGCDAYVRASVPRYVFNVNALAGSVLRLQTYVESIYFDGAVFVEVEAEGIETCLQVPINKIVPIRDVDACELVLDDSFSEFLSEFVVL